MKYKIPPDHGFEHVLYVASLARLGIRDFPNMRPADATAILVAAMLHDVDDYKIFPNNHNFPNANEFLDMIQDDGLVDADFAYLVLTMINLVSYSKNQNYTREDDPSWLYIPRDADRIACGGRIGIERTLEYNNRSEPVRPLIQQSDLDYISNLDLDPSQITRHQLDNLCIRSIGSQRVQSVRESILQFYLSDWSNRSICVSESISLQRYSFREYAVLSDWMCSVIKYYARGVEFIA